MFQRDLQCYFAIPSVSLCASFSALTTKDRLNRSESIKTSWAPLEPDDENFNITVWKPYMFTNTNAIGLIEM